MKGNKTGADGTGRNTCAGIVERSSSAVTSMVELGSCAKKQKKGRAQLRLHHGQLELKAKPVD
jgi:hypothetical protein